MIVTGEPCTGCCKAIVRAGIGRVIYKQGVYGGENGISFLIENHVVVTTIQELESE